MPSSSYSFGRLLGKHYVLTLTAAGLLSVFAIYRWYTTPKEPTVAPPKSAPIEAKLTQDDIEINIVLAGARRLKDAMKKPETFELLYAGMIDGKLICYEYRARNSYNDRTVETYVVSDTISSGKPAAWNKYCVGKNPKDYTSVRSLL